MGWEKAAKRRVRVMKCYYVCGEKLQGGWDGLLRLPLAVLITIQFIQLPLPMTGRGIIKRLYLLKNVHPLTDGGVLLLCILLSFQILTTISFIRNSIMDITHAGEKNLLIYKITVTNFFPCLRSNLSPYLLNSCLVLSALYV